jgi:hypothetical protein
MSANDTWKVPAVALVLLLTACGGGGGGDAFEPVDISTSAGALMAALLAVQVTEADHAGDTAAAGGSAQGSLLAGHWLPKARPPIARAKRGGGQGATAPAATTTEPCTDGGSTVYYDPILRDVDSPYTDVLFSVDRHEDHDCTNVYGDETGSSTFYSDGSFESGCPAEDLQTCSIQYLTFGTPQARARFRLTYTDSFSGDFEIDSVAHGVMHVRYDANDSNYSRIDESGFVSFDVDESFVDNGEGGSGATTAYSLSGYTGTAASPFLVHDDDPGISVEGPYGLSSSDLPDCELGEATLHTLVPMYVDWQTSNVVGTVEVTSGVRVAVVDMKADGTVEVTIDGQTETLTADQVGAIKAGCLVGSTG